MGRGARESMWLGRIASLVLVVLFFFCIEMIARYAIKQNKLDGILVLLEQSQELFWRQKSNLSLRFEGSKVVTDDLGLRNSRETLKNFSFVDLKIVCLGASPTFGWGVDSSDTYPAQLKTMIQRSISKNAEVINAGQIGFSSYQGKIYLKNEISALHPDIVTVSYVLNDLDRYRFFRSNGVPDKLVKSEPLLVLRIRNILSNSRLCNVLERRVIPFFSDKMRLSGNRGILRLPQLRVSKDDYRDNLEQIIYLCQKKNIKLVFIVMPVNLPRYSNLSVFDRSQVDNGISMGKQLLESGKPQQAMQELNKALNLNPLSSEALFYLGVCYRLEGQMDKAKMYFRESRSKEIYRCGEDGVAYNQIMREVAEQHNIPLVDAAQVFSGQSAYLFVDSVSDPIHPNAAGHALISKELYAALENNGLLTIHR